MNNRAFFPPRIADRWVLRHQRQSAAAVAAAEQIASVRVLAYLIRYRLDRVPFPSIRVTRNVARPTLADGNEWQLVTAEACRWQQMAISNCRHLPMATNGN